ncbi:unnamed protein product [Rotaria sp. Silwood1]|nr:unnamed protein product [Rotaria sp. Silwood1]CAF1033543.1 unnamed protein product [Rotaria sp. Silwood1]CAF4680455.1 unnamed protein product [Rotaria sp. Silwood1]
MKYTITRTFSLKNEKFEIACDIKPLCTVKASPSKEYKDRYNVKFSNAINGFTGEKICIVEPDPSQPQSYLIFLNNDETNETSLFGQLSYQLCSYDNYFYTIVIGQKLYQVRSRDLKDRRLTIVDRLQSNDSSFIYCPETLFQVLDSFSKSNKKYHVIIKDKKCQYGYLAIIILLYLHECKQNIS